MHVGKTQKNMPRTWHPRSQQCDELWRLMALGLTDGFSNVPWQPTWGPEGGQVRRVTVCVWKYMAWWKYAKNWWCHNEWLVLMWFSSLHRRIFRYLDVGEILRYMELMGKKWQDVLAPRVLREGLYNEKDEQKHGTHGWWVYRFVGAKRWILFPATLRRWVSFWCSWHFWQADRLTLSGCCRFETTRVLNLVVKFGGKAPIGKYWLLKDVVRIGFSLIHLKNQSTDTSLLHQPNPYHPNSPSATSWERSDIRLYIFFFLM